MAKYTRTAIIHTFMELLTYKSLDKITVKDIIEETEINRNTFYYYFDDIYDLIDQMFEESLKKILSEAEEGSSFYDEYIRLASVLNHHKKAIIHIYHSKSREILHQYVWKITNVFIERFVRKEASDYSLSEEGIEYITYFYSSAISGNTMKWIHDEMPSCRKNFMSIIASSFEATIDDMILNYRKFEKE